MSWKANVKIFILGLRVGALVFLLGLFCRIGNLTEREWEWTLCGERIEYSPPGRDVVRQCPIEDFYCRVTHLKRMHLALADQNGRPTRRLAQTQTRNLVVGISQSGT